MKPDMIQRNEVFRLFPDIVWMAIFGKLDEQDLLSIRDVCKGARQTFVRLNPCVNLKFTPPHLDKVLLLLRSLQSIQHITLIVLETPQQNNAFLDDVDLSELAQLLGQNTQLRSLHVIDDTSSSTWTMPWHSLAGLETLHMQNGTLAISTAADLDLLTALRSLSLNNGSLPGADSIPLANIFSKHMLTSLSLGVYRGWIPEGLAGISALRLLQSLDLFSNCVDGFSGMTTLSALTALTALTCLSLRNFKDLQSVAFLAPLVHLRHLRFSCFGQYLVAAPTFTSNLALEVLDLYYFQEHQCGFSSSQLQLAGLTCLTNLTRLDLSSALNQKRNLDTTPLHSLSALHTLNLWGNRYLHRPAAEALIAAMPALRVLDLSGKAADLSFSR